LIGNIRKGLDLALTTRNTVAYNTTVFIAAENRFEKTGLRCFERGLFKLNKRLTNETKRI